MEAVQSTATAPGCATAAAPEVVAGSGLVKAKQILLLLLLLLLRRISMMQRCERICGQCMCAARAA